MDKKQKDFIIDKLTKIQKEEIKTRLFYKQKCRCCYCDKYIDPISYKTNPIPENSATIEHLHNKYSRKRMFDNTKILACRICNHKKGACDEKEYIKKHGYENSMLPYWKRPKMEDKPKGKRVAWVTSPVFNGLKIEKSNKNAGKQFSKQRQNS